VVYVLWVTDDVIKIIICISLRSFLSFMFDDLEIVNLGLRFFFTFIMLNKKWNVK